MRYFQKVLALFSLCLCVTVVTTAQTGIAATALAILNVRGGPSVDYGVVSVINRGTQLVVTGRNEASDWFYVHTSDDSIRGWVAIGFIEFDHPIRVREELPLVGVDAVEAVAVTNAETTTTTTDTPDLGELPATETNYPEIWFDAEVQQNVQAIYQRGHDWGRQANSFMKVGDSNVAGDTFLCNFHWGSYDLASYPNLQAVVDRFEESASFCRYFVSAQPGFSTFTLLDSTFAPPDLCAPNETPLTCEIRRSNPTYAVVFIGMGDVLSISESQFRGNLTFIVRTLGDNGVIPILTTFPMSPKAFPPGQSELYNNVIREVGQSERVPIIDARVAVWNLPNHGIDETEYHLSRPAEKFTSFGGHQGIYGNTRYELLTMQLLYRMITEVNPQ